MDKILKGSNIIKEFGNGNERTKVLNNVSIEIEKEEFVAVMGPSGSGKTTMLFALSGTDTIDQGTILFEENDISKMKEKNLADLRRKKFGFVFQQPTMLKNLNVLDNIILPAIQENRKNRKMINQRAEELMNKTGINGLGKRGITEVSGGQLQRAGICRAIIGSPDILFADEPTGALNSKSADEVMNIFTNINEEGTAILLVTHDAKVASRADRVLFMKDGQIVNELSFKEIENYSINKKFSIIQSEMIAVGI